VLLSAVTRAAPTFDDGRMDRRMMALYDYIDNTPPEVILQLLQNQLTAQRLYQGEGSVKRSRGMLDFGVSRGASGSEAAKARLGLKLASDPYGPGRRR